MWKNATRNGTFRWTYLKYFKNECKDESPQSYYFYPNRSYNYQQIELDLHRYMMEKEDAFSSQISMDPIEFRIAPTPTTRKERAMQLYSCLEHMSEDASYHSHTIAMLPLENMNTSRMYNYSLIIILMILALIYLQSVKGENKIVISYVLAFLLFYYLITAMFYNRIL